MAISKGAIHTGYGIGLALSGASAASLALSLRNIERPESTWHKAVSPVIGITAGAGAVGLVTLLASSKTNPSLVAQVVGSIPIGMSDAAIGAVALGVGAGIVGFAGMAIWQLSTGIIGA